MRETHFWEAIMQKSYTLYKHSIFNIASIYHVNDNNITVLLSLKLNIILDGFQYFVLSGRQDNRTVEYWSGETEM